MRGRGIFAADSFALAFARAPDGFALKLPAARVTALIEAGRGAPLVMPLQKLASLRFVRVCRTRSIGLWLACALCFWTACACSPATRRVPPEAVDGVLDLRTWDFASDGAIELNGVWEFYWGARTPPEIFASAPPPAPSALVQVPGLWNGQIVQGRALPGEGFATYKLKVLLPPEVGPLAVRIYDGQGSAYRLFWNGELAAYNGAPGRSAAEERPEYLPQTARVRRAPGAATVVMQISNHSHRNGGFQVPILLGSAERIFAARDRARTANAFLAGALLIMALYHCRRIKSHRAGSTAALLVRHGAVYGLCRLYTTRRRNGAGRSRRNITRMFFRL